MGLLSPGVGTLGGLVNEGNSCYINCILQALAASPPLMGYIRDAGERERPVAYALCQLLTAINESQSSAHSHSVLPLVRVLEEQHVRMDPTLPPGQAPATRILAAGCQAATRTCLASSPKAT